MSFAEKHNHTQEFPTYSVQYKKAAEMADEKKHLVTWVGAYDGKYGREAYIDVLEGEDHLRVKVPSWMNKDIEAISRDAEDMADIKAGKVLVKFETFKTKNGYDSARAVWSDRVAAQAAIDSSQLPF